jgi:ABC-type antimicrobial peptide transport system permease subunit
LEKVSTGATLGHTADVTHGMTCRAIGHVEGLDQLLAIHFSEEDNSDE